MAQGVPSKPELEERIREIWRELLECPDMGLDDDFFAMGGHSIIAMKFAMRADKELGLKIPTNLVFKHPTASTIAAALTSEAAPIPKAASPSAPDKLPVERRKVPLSRFQMKFWLAAKVWPERKEHNYAYSYDLKGPLDTKLLAKAWLETMRLHVTACSVYMSDEEGNVCMCPDADMQAERPVHSWERKFPRDYPKEKGMEEFISEFALPPYDLEKSPPARLAILKLSEERHLVVFAMHHVIGDGVTVPLMPPEWSAIYNALARGETLELQSDSFEDYIALERRLFTPEKEKASLEYLKRLCDGVPLRLELPRAETGLPPVKKNLEIEFPGELVANLKKLARSCASTLFLAYGGAYSILAMRYAGKKSCLPLYFVSHKPTGFANLVCSFVDSMPMRVEFDGRTSFREMLRELTAQRKESKKFQSCRFEDFLNEIKQERGETDRQGQFNFSFNMTTLASAPLALEGVSCRQLPPLDSEMTDDLLLNIESSDDKKCFLSYNASFFTTAFAEEFALKLKGLLEAIVERPDAPLQELLGSLGAFSGSPDDEALTIQDESVPTHMQMRLLFLQQIEEKAPYAYNIPFFWEFKGEPDLAALNFAIEELVRRQESLRTVFQKGKLLVLPPKPLNLQPEPLKDSELEEAMLMEACRRFDLENGPLFAPRLWRVSGEEGERLILSLNVNHIVFDGWSGGLMMRELKELYEAWTEKRKPELPELPLQYQDYARRQNQFVQSREMKSLLDKCCEYLDGACTDFEIFPDKLRPELRSMAGSAAAFYVDRELRQSLESLRRQAKVSPFVLLLAAFGALLRHYAGEDDIVIGAPAACRDREDMRDLIGFFVNTIPVRMDMSKDPSFREFLEEVKGSVAEAMGYQDVPLDQIVQRLKLPHRSDRLPLIQTMFSYQDEMKPACSFGSVGLDALYAPRLASHFDLTLDLIPDGDALIGILEYNSDLFNSETARRIVSHYIRILQELVKNPDAKLSELPFISDDEKSVALGPEMSGPPIEPLPARLTEMLELKAKEDPEAMALVHKDWSLSRKELVERAGAWAELLMRHGLKKGCLLGVAANPGVNLVPLIVAALKSGLVFVPIDPKTPESRAADILSTADIKALIHSDKASPIAACCRSRGILLIDESSEGGKLKMGGAGAKPQIAIAPEDPAYIIFTSGTTGVPKGALVSHGSFELHCRACIDAYSLTERDRFLQFAPVFFDAGLEQLFPPLLAGATVFVRGDEVWPATEFHIRAAEMKLSVVDLPPLYIRELLNFWEWRPEAAPRGLRMALAGGEALPVDVARKWLASPLGNVPLLNVYGPTEAVITSSFFRVHSNAADAPTAPAAPIGRPMPGRLLRVLNPQGNPLPPGVPGELCIGGQCLADGYYRNPEATSKAFRFWSEKDGRGHWQDGPGAAAVRLYRSGDKVRLTDCGIIEFLGRIDRQIKLRGFRIEPGEIEASLRSHPEIAEAYVTLAQCPGSKESFLAAYLVPKGREPDADKLRDWLSGRLPPYMLPRNFHFLERLPLTSAGKIDERKLPQPKMSPSRSKPAEAPLTEREKEIAELWKEVLGRDSVGRNDNFFDIGGHSILLVRLHALICKRLGVALELVELFRNTTVASQAQALAGKAAQAAAPEKRQPVKSSGDIAIIGMAGRFPMAGSVEEFWENLKAERECVSFFSREELLKAGVPKEEIESPGFVGAGGVLDGLELFDAGFFEITPREASTMDPQHRIFLETAWHALEDAGCDPKRFPGAIGVFAGCGMNTYLTDNLIPSGAFENAPDFYQLGMNNDKDFIATRVSYKFGLRGPGVNVNTACSTSLVAVHLACKALLNGDCDMALAGSISAHSRQVSGYVFQKNGIASQDGHCRPFASDSSGTVAGSGLGIVALKPLEKALADGDNVRAVIKGSAINNDGSAKVGFTAPGLEGQRSVIRAALAASGIGARSVSYVEAHGTATALGDLVEVKALSEAFAEDTGEKAFCALGAVKSNVGHMDTAAGAAGLIKAVLALESKFLPRTLHGDASNPQIKFPETPFFPLTRSRAWDFGGTPRRAGVSSFGMGGTNAHAILEESPKASPRKSYAGPCFLLPLSTRSEKALSELEESLARFLEKRSETNLGDVFFTLAMGRAEFKFRSAVACSSSEEAVEKLRSPKRDSGKEILKPYPELQHCRDAWLSGETPDWSKVFGEGTGKRIPLPGYPFQRQRHWVEAPKPGEPAKGSVSQKAIKKDKDLSECFYVPSWRRLSAAQPCQKDEAELAIISGGSAEEEQVLDFLRRQGRKFTLLKPGSLKGFNAGGKRALHLGLLSSAPDKEPQRRLEWAKKAALLEPLEMAKSIPKPAEGKLEIVFLTSRLCQAQEGDAMLPEKSLLWGPARVIQQEYKNISCRIIDLGLDEDGRISESSMYLLESELVRREPPFLTALRSRAWERCYVQSALGEEAKKAALKDALKDGGVYLITGGIGGIGLSLAQFIAESCGNSKIALLSRSAFPERRNWPKIAMKLEGDKRQRDVIEKVMLCEERGAKVMIVTADVGKGSELKKACSEIAESFGPISGLVHAAGVPGGSLIAGASEEDLLEVLEPKADGLLRLAESIPFKELDFIALCSSLNGLLGGPGQAAYASANAYLDAFAEANEPGAPRLVSLAWDTWKDVGMAVRAARGEFSGRKKQAPYPMESVLLEMSVSPESYWPLGEHRIGDDCVLPGTGSLAIVCQTLSKDGTVPCHLKDFRIAAPVSIPAEEGGASIAMRLGLSGDKLAIHSQKARSEWMENVSATLLHEIPAAKKLDLAGIKERCKRKADGIAMASSDKGIVVNAGPHWDIPEEIHFGDTGEALAALRLPDGREQELSGHPFHPAMLDLATAFVLAEEPDGMEFLPYEFGELTVRAPLSKEIFSYARRKESQTGRIVCDFTVTDSSGSVLLEINGFTLLKVSGRIKPSGAEKPAARAAETKLSELAISPQEGVELFARALGSRGEPRFCVCAGDLEEELSKAASSDWREAAKLAPDAKAGAVEKRPRPPLSSAYRKPESGTECAIERVWSDLLGISGIGLDDDLFELGASSLLAIQALSRLERELSCQIPIDRFFAAPNIAGLAAASGKADGAGGSAQDWEEGEI